MKYKNYSHTTKTFYGIKFKPGETHDVPGYINDPKFVRVKGVEISDSSVQSAEPVLQVKKCTPLIAGSVTTKRTTRTKTTTKEEELINGTDCDQ